MGKYWLGRKCCLFTFSLHLGQQRNLNSKPQEFRAPPTKNILYGAMLGAMCEMYGGKRVGEALAWEEVLSFYIQFVLGSAKEFKLKPQKLWAPTTKKLRMVPCWGQCAGCMGEKWFEKHWLERKCCLFTFSLCLGQQRNFSSKPEKLLVLCLGQQRNLNSKPQELPAPPTKNTLYGAMLGAMCEKGLGKHWFGRKCCLFTFSLCLGQQKNLNSNLKNFGPQPQKSFLWCHVGDNVRDAWGKNSWRNTGLRGSAVFLHSVCAWVSKGL